MRRASEQTIDGEVVSRFESVTQVGPQEHVQTIPVTPQDTMIGGGPAAPPTPIPTSVDQLDRSITLFVEVPLLAVVALHPNVNPLIRVGAALLGFYRIKSVASPVELNFNAPEPM